ncbi:LapA family protein [Streptacidiphilus sp. MAP5-3]|uniref:LapA family protein n=1 Tax=unclassified Streptacidiphilus TaxID=2643834 RepID=UPI0035112323
MAKNPAPAPQPSSLTLKGRQVRLRTIGIAVLAALSVWFVAANTESVAIKLWVTTVTLPLWGVLLVTLVVGAVIGWAMARRRAKH